MKRMDPSKCFNISFIKRYFCLHYNLQILSHTNSHLLHFLKRFIKSLFIKKNVLMNRKKALLPLLKKPRHASDIHTPKYKESKTKKNKN